MLYVPVRGGTFLVPSGPSGLHLFVIVTSPCPNNSVLLLSVSTIRAGRYYDPTCVFNGGEHQFITHPSYVVYSKAQQRFVQPIQACVDGGSFIPKLPLDEQHLTKMCQGIFISDRTQPWASDYYNQHSTN